MLAASQRSMSVAPWVVIPTPTTSVGCANGSPFPNPGATGNPRYTLRIAGSADGAEVHLWRKGDPIGLYSGTWTPRDWVQITPPSALRFATHAASQRLSDAFRQGEID